MHDHDGDDRFHQVRVTHSEHFYFKCENYADGDCLKSKLYSVLLKAKKALCYDQTVTVVMVQRWAIC